MKSALSAAIVCLVVFAFTTVFVLTASAATRTWDNGGAGSNWSTDANWSDNTQPIDKDDVIFDSTSVANVTIDDVGTWTGGTLYITTDYSGIITQEVDVSVASSTQAAGTLTVASSKTFTALNDMTINGGTMNHSDNSDAEVHKLIVIVGGDLTIGVNGVIDVDELGYDSAAGPGGTDSGNQFDGSTHGGAGGDHDGDGITRGVTYGSSTKPFSLGSGGGAGVGGGGAIKINVVGTATIDGSISATGETGGVWNAAGGSVWLTTGYLDGSGDVDADGGGSAVGGLVGGGGGGRVAVILTGSGADFTDFSGTITAYGGEVLGDGNGAAGTVYKATAAQGSSGGELLIDNNNIVVVPAAVLTDLQGQMAATTTVGSIKVQNLASFQIGIDDGLTLTADGTAMTVGANSILALTPGSTLSISGTAVSNSGTWTIATSSIVTFTGQDDDADVTVPEMTYGNLAFNNGGTVFALAADTIVVDDLTIAAGTLDVSTSDYALTLYGDWNNSGGVFTPRSSTVTFASTTAAHNITSNGSAFYDLIFNDAGGSATWQLLDTLDVDNDLTITGGVLDANGEAINLAGDWTNNDTFTANNNSLTLDGGDQTINNSNTFYNLIKNASNAQVLIFASGQTQTIGNALELGGSASGHLSLRSSSGGTQWELDPQGTRTVGYLGVQDSNNIGSPNVDCQNKNCIDDGNNINWDFGDSSDADGVDYISGGLVYPIERVPGCTDSLADNFNPNATENDSSCIFSGCTDLMALNYNPLANQDDGTCAYLILVERPVDIIEEVVILGDDTEDDPTEDPDDDVEDSIDDTEDPVDETGDPDEEINVLADISPSSNIVDSTLVSVQEQARVAWQEVIVPVAPSFITQTLPPLLAIWGIIAGLLQIAAISVRLLSLFDIYLLIWRGLSALLGFLGFRKKHRPWGTVYDAVTKQPIDPAYVSVLNANNNEEVVSAITDIDGRFGFLLPDSGDFRLKAKKSHYRFPSQILAGRTQDELYGSLYFGEDIKTEPGKIIDKNIPLDPIGFDWNEFAKNKQHFFQIYSRRELIWARIFGVLFALGLATAMISALIQPTWPNGLVLFIYLIVYTLKWWWRRGHESAQVYRKAFPQDGSPATTEPLSFGVIRAHVPELDQEVKRVVADMFGRFFLLLRPGTYYLTFEEKLSDGSYRLVHKTGLMELKTGLFSKKLTI
ncbi:MAG: hypothetical protein U9M92_00105 [Patescibacteria group bacterium]|nr:hypothetical protein [Patescibacteria group bacterium]